MAQALNIPVTVEGVETDRQLQYVRDLGCDFVQGYLIARPMDGKDILTFLNTGNCVGGAEEIVTRHQD
ncbi:EAL domain-containing protein [Acidiphilium sp. PA]|nr:EAL domain-containing protein [Acidiphilium sp. PA]